jgi:hypothetical protein
MDMMRMASGTRLIVTAMAMTSAGAVQAQMRDPTGSTFGTAGRKVQIEVSGDVLYDTNLTGGRGTVASARGLEKEDVRFSPGVDLDIAVPVASAVVTLAGSLNYDFYARNTQLNRERINLLGAAGTRVAICDLSVSSGVNRRQSDQADLSIVPGDPQSSSVNAQTVFSVGGTVTCGQSIGIRPTAYVRYTTTDNSDPDRRVSNAETLIYGGGLSYTSPAFGVLTAFVGRTEYRFPNRAGRANIAGIDRLSGTQFGASLDRRLGARLQVNGEVSYLAANAPFGLGKEASGFNWDVGAALLLGPRARLTANVSSMLDVTTNFNTNFGRTKFYGAQLQYVLTPLIRLTTGVSRRERELDNIFLLAPTAAITGDRLDEASATLRYMRGTRLSFLLGAAYRKRTADNPIYDFEGLRGSFGVKLRL